MGWSSRFVFNNFTQSINLLSKGLRSYTDVDTLGRLSKETRAKKRPMKVVAMQSENIFGSEGND